MTGPGSFADYYGVLQVHPNCDAKILESAYHYLAKRYHPDHSGTADTTKFNEVTQAYKVLRNPKKRAEYDARLKPQKREAHVEAPGPRFAEGSSEGIDENAALTDADDHAKILMYLYEKRRENAQDAGVIGFYLQKMLQCSDARFDFHKWYLKEKGFVALTEQGSLAITIQGVDHVISMSRATRAEKLFLARAADMEDCGSD